MGWKWEVSAWVDLGEDGWQYETAYSGQSLFRAILAARRAKRDGSGCVKVEWRA